MGKPLSHVNISLNNDTVQELDIKDSKAREDIAELDSKIDSSVETLSGDIGDLKDYTDGEIDTLKNSLEGTINDLDTWAREQINNINNNYPAADTELLNYVNAELDKIWNRSGFVYYFVAPNGNDDNDGLSAVNPKATITAVLADVTSRAVAMKNTVTIICAEGTYSENVVFDGFECGFKLNIVANGRVYWYGSWFLSSVDVTFTVFTQDNTQCFYFCSNDYLYYYETYKVMLRFIQSRVRMNYVSFISVGTQVDYIMYITGDSSVWIYSPTNTSGTGNIAMFKVEFSKLIADIAFNNINTNIVVYELAIAILQKLNDKSQTYSDPLEQSVVKGLNLIDVNQE